MQTRIITDFDRALALLPDSVRDKLSAVPYHVREAAWEIRLRVGRRAAVTYGGENFLCGMAITAEEIACTLEKLCAGSVYSCEHQITDGFISLAGGVRAGVCGSAVCRGGAISSVRDVSCINIRIPREVYGAADELMAHFDMGGMLIISPPSFGKTTVLRDMARQLSDKRNLRVCVLDERSELAGCVNGIASKNVGQMTDIMSGYPKAQGIEIAIRTMSPQVLICDEIGGEDEAKAVGEAAKCGVAVIATAHARDIRELTEREPLAPLMKSGAFTAVAVIGKTHRMEKIYKLGKAGIWQGYGENNDL